MDDRIRRISDLLPDTTASRYDALKVSEPHMKRLIDTFLDGAPYTPDILPTTWAGMTVEGSPAVPEGFAIAMLDGKPVGIINFDTGEAVLKKPDRPI
jgi:hypothetical protein